MGGDKRRALRSIFAPELEEILDKLRPLILNSSGEIREQFPQPLLDDILNYRYAVNLELMRSVPSTPEALSVEVVDDGIYSGFQQS